MAHHAVEKKNSVLSAVVRTIQPFLSYSYLNTAASLTLAAPCDTQLSFHSFLHSFIPTHYFHDGRQYQALSSFLNNRVNDRIVSFPNSPFGTYPTTLRLFFFIYFSLDFPHNYLLLRMQLASRSFIPATAQSSRRRRHVCPFCRLLPSLYSLRCVVSSH
jgi:hypothetical protein